MSRLVDTTICPDCRGALDEGATCTACGLRVRGPLARELWSAMVAADGVVERLRAETVSEMAPTLTPTLTPALTPGVAPPPASSAFPRYPSPTSTPPARRRLPAASVPVVLLSLGALCVLVAGIVFVAVTWSLLGLTGRTLVLLGCTTALAAVAVLLTRKGLRGAAETFWLVVAGMLAVDLLAADSAGLAGLDALSWRGTGALVGGVLLALGTVVGLWARTSPLTRLYGAESVAVIGGLVLSSTNAWFAENPAVASTVAVPLLGVAFLLLRRAVPLAAYGLGGLGAASWLVLVGVGWGRALELSELGDWWADVRGWPLIAAAALGAVVVHLPGVTDRVRSVIAGLALVPLVLLANGPQSTGTPTRDLLIGCASLLVLAMVAALAPHVWARGAAVLSALGVAALGLWLVVGPWSVLSTLDLDGRTDPGLAMLALDDNAASWSNLVVAVVVAVAVACLLRHVPAAVRGAATRAVGTVAPAVVALGSLVMVLELEPPLWAGVLAAALATAIAGSAAWWSRDHVFAGALGSVATGYLALVSLYAAAAADLLTALTASALFAVLAVAATLRDRAGALPSAAIGGSAAALVGGLALTGWGQVMEADAAARAIALAAYAGMVAVAAAPLTRRLSTRVTLESTAIVVAVIATGLAPDDTSSAMVLTILGTAICLIGVTTRDRALAGWAGALVLGIATILRAMAEVSAPELYTLPAAALLVAAGAWRLHREPGSSSFTVVGSGLTLGLLPSLLLALDEPVSVRGALIGVAAVVVLAVGLQQRLAAPFVLGALTTAVLALRHLEPVAEAVPRWISLGVVGVVLLVVGVTWESRRRDLDTAHRYLSALR